MACAVGDSHHVSTNLQPVLSRYLWIRLLRAMDDETFFGIWQAMDILQMQLEAEAAESMDKLVPPVQPHRASIPKCGPANLAFIDRYGRLSPRMKVPVKGLNPHKRVRPRQSRRRKHARNRPR